MTNYVVMVRLAKPGKPGQCWEVDTIVTDKEFEAAGVDHENLKQKKLVRVERAKKGKSK